MIEFTCDFCSILTKKALSEFKRNQELGRKNYCSRSCVGKDNCLKNFGDKVNRDTSHLKNYVRKDEFTGLRQFIRRANNRTQHEVNITKEYLKEIWDKQNGICIYSKIPLELPSDRKKNNVIYTASLDRIDSSKGYIIDNVQFISMGINYMKTTMSHEDTIKLIDLIKRS